MKMGFLYGLFAASALVSGFMTLIEDGSQPRPYPPDVAKFIITIQLTIIVFCLVVGGVAGHIWGGKD